MKIKIEGHGEIVVRVPKKNEWCNANIKQAITDGVLATLRLVDPPIKNNSWHPVLGEGGYIETVK